MCKNMFNVPQLSTNLMSISQMDRNNKEVIFNTQVCRIFDANKNFIATSSLINDVYQLDLNRVVFGYNSYGFAWTCSRRFSWWAKYAFVVVDDYTSKTFVFLEEKNLKILLVSIISKHYLRMKPVRK